MSENKYREKYSEYRSSNERFVVTFYRLSLNFYSTAKEKEIPTNMMFMTVHWTIKNQDAAKKQFV